MGKSRTHRSLHRDSMQFDGTPSVELLLPANRAQCLRSYAHEARRRDLYRVALLWLTEDSPGVKKEGARGQSETDPRDYARTWFGWKTTRAQHFKITSRASKIPVPSTRYRDSRAPGSLELGHHVHPIEKRLCLSCCRDGLVQSASSLTSGLKQPGDGLLFRSLRRGDCPLRSARYFQYRSGSSVHLARIYRGGTQQGHPIQYGWSRKGARQHFCRASMEISKI